MREHPPIAGGNDARLGDAILVIEQPAPVFLDINIDPYVETPDEILMALMLRVNLLEQQVADLQQQTLSAYWHRFTAWLHHLWVSIRG